MTKDGSAFQTRAPATGKARSPIVILRVGGTTSAGVDAERSRFLESLSVSILIDENINRPLRKSTSWFTWRIFTQPFSLSFLTLVLILLLGSHDDNNNQ